MKKNQKKIIMTTLLGMSAGIGLYTLVNNPIIESHASKKGERRVIQDPQHAWIQFNPAYRDDNKQPSKQYQFYKDRKMWREVYGKLGFVWYSTVPPSNDTKEFTLKKSDRSYMLENRQTDLGSAGAYLVQEASSTGYRNNIKYGSADPYTYQYFGKNSGQEKILYGQFVGKHYEFRFLGYNDLGTAIGNPYFPPDYPVNQFKGKTKSQIASIKAKEDWIPESWNLSYSKNAFGVSDYNGKLSQKIKWINQYLFPEYPAFKKAHNASWWADRLMPLTDPSSVTGVWLGWHNVNGQLRYMTTVTAPPKQPNLRLIHYEVYDSENHLLATATRGDKNYIDNNLTVTYSKTYKSVSPGETYKVVAKVKNMDFTNNDIKNYPITLDALYTFDKKIGKAGYYDEKSTEQADTPNERNLKTGETATFTYHYTVPVDRKDKRPTGYVEFKGTIPSKYIDDGYDVNDADDTSAIQLPVAKENLAVQVVGFYDASKNQVTHVTPGREMWVKLKMTKTNSGKGVKDPELDVQMSNSTFINNKNTLTNQGVYTKTGNKISDNTLKEQGDYAIFWANIHT